MRKWLGLSLTVLGYAFLTMLSATPVYACSGGPPPWEEWLPLLVEQSDVIVLGQYVELDEAEANGILRIETYLQGEGAEHLLIRSNNTLHLENWRNVNRRYPSCLQTSYISTNHTYLYFLSRQHDGTYQRNYWRYFDLHSIELNTLKAQITAAVGTAPQAPNPDLAYPRTTPILITTTNDKHFLLPVDTLKLVAVAEDDLPELRRDQYECSTPPCAVYSPNGLNKVNLQATETEEQLREYNPYIESDAVGERIVFSATSDTYALWHDNQIELYVLWYPRLGYPDDFLSDVIFTSEFLHSIPAGDSLEYPVSWSEDGRMLAFSTHEGLWLWDALTFDYPPQLLLPATSVVPTVRYFSPQGRYLAVTEGDRRYNLDLVTKRELPDGYVSPDDRTLLIFDTVADSPTTLEVAYLAPGIRRTEYYPEVEFFDVAWIDSQYFLASITGFSYTKYETVTYETSAGEMAYEAFPYVVEEPFVDVVTYHSSGIFWIQRELQVPYPIEDVQMRAFSYADGPGLIKISADGYHLEVDDKLLSLTLPAPIAEAMWLPSPFYYEQN